MPISRRFEFNIFADYFQFYLQDEGAGGDLSESWTPDAVDRLLAIAPGTIGVGTVRNVHVPVVVEIAEGEPHEDLTEWDHVTQCSIDVPSGRIVVAGCTDYFPDAARIEVSHGTYNARVYYGKLRSLSNDGLQGDDRYRIVLWKGDPVPLQVIKRRVPA